MQVACEYSLTLLLTCPPSSEGGLNIEECRDCPESGSALMFLVLIRANSVAGGGAVWV